MPERFKVVCIPCKALYKCSAFYFYSNSQPLNLHLRSRGSLFQTVGQHGSRTEWTILVGRRLLKYNLANVVSWLVIVHRWFWHSEATNCNHGQRFYICRHAVLPGPRNVPGHSILFKSWCLGMSHAQTSHSRFSGQFPCLNASYLLAIMPLINLFLLLDPDVFCFVLLLAWSILCR